MNDSDRPYSAQCGHTCTSQCDNCHTAERCVPAVTRVGDLLLCADCAVSAEIPQCGICRGRHYAWRPCPLDIAADRMIASVARAQGIPWPDDDD